MQDEHDKPNGKRHGSGMGRMSKALAVSLSGVREALRCEAAFRQELAIGAVFAVAALMLEVTPAERGVLLASIFIVLIVELLNTALEVTLDRITLEEDPSVRKAKDMGSAAVFLSIVAAGVVWICITGPLVYRALS
ncbi:diacylglycerol kinase [Pseudohoeflea suaedae]|uniref:Diacylglycerol kinase n=2 Tax=Pseudohoeflea suaedae TaxID=877384 RepID=A0A4R5PL19_9HYPH|nr:diacylglycerol kinase [Pseudohoeflea suaedae]